MGVAFLAIPFGYLDKLRAYPVIRWSILAGDVLPPFAQAAAMAGVPLLVGMLIPRDERASLRPAEAEWRPVTGGTTGQNGRAARERSRPAWGG